MATRYFTTTPSRLPVSAGGRSSVSGLKATIFGASGFYGRYFTDRLGRIGTQVRVPFRGDGMESRHLRVMGDVGQINPVPFQLTDKESIANCVAGSNLVVNLIGRHFETRNFSFTAVHVDGTRAIVEAAKAAGVERFVQVSALGAHPKSKSTFLRTKFAAEKVVREVYPDAIILRPAITFGFEDRFFNRYANWTLTLPVVPIIQGGYNKIQPVFVEDVADAMLSSLNTSTALGKTFELGGPSVICMKDILEDIAEDIGKESNTVSLLKPVAMMYGKLLQLSPWPPLLTCDEVQQMSTDLVVSPICQHTFKQLKIEPKSIESKMHSLLSMYRSDRSYRDTDQKAAS